MQKRSRKEHSRPLTAEQLKKVAGGVQLNPLYMGAGVDMNPLYVGHSIVDPEA